MKKKKSFLRFLPLILATAILIVVLFVPSPIDAAAWTPLPFPEATGALAPNDALLDAKFLGESQLNQPEDLAFDDEGRIYSGSADGNIYRLTLAANGNVLKFETFATVGGYPAGLRFDKSGNLVAAVKDIGLLSIDPTGKAELLTDEAEGTTITYANALDITSEGVIYFSDSSTKFDRGWPYDVLEARPHGRLLMYSPDKQETRVIRNNLYFANGVVLSPDESYLLVSETTRYRIARYWLKGDKAGSWDYFAENLPLLPDNISRAQDGNFLVGGVRRISLIDNLQPNAFLKNQFAKIPLKILREFPTLKRNRYGLILILDVDGNIKQSLQDSTGRIYAVSSARVYNGFIYIGTVLGNDIARYPYAK